MVPVTAGAAGVGKVVLRAGKGRRGLPQGPCRAGDLLGAVITTLDQKVRPDVTDQLLRRVLGKRDHPVHTLQCSKHGHAPVQWIDRSTLALQASHRVIVIHGHNQAITESTRLAQVEHVPGVQDVEAAVRHYDTLAVGFRIGHHDR